MSRTPVVPDGMPVLSAGRHRSPSRGACFMEYASYLAGERWSDHPECTHPLLAALARDVNDLTTNAGRSRLVDLVPRVVGLNPPGAAYTAEIALVVASAALPIVSLERQRALAVGLVSLVRRTADPRLAERAAEAFRGAPDTEQWAIRYLEKTKAPQGSWARAAESMVHTATVGIALACVDDPDQYLRRALVAAIEAGERRMPAAPRTQEAVVFAS